MSARSNNKIPNPARKSVRKSPGQPKSADKNTFNADTVRAECEKEIAKVQKAAEKEAEMILLGHKNATKKRISEIPEMIKSIIGYIGRNGDPKEVKVIAATDWRLGSGYISKSTSNDEAENEILQIPPVKDILEWAESKGFGYRISVTNTYWELYLTW